MTDDAGLQAKRVSMETILRDLGSAAIAFSGGVDSTLLLAEACRVLGLDKAYEERILKEKRST